MEKQYTIEELKKLLEQFEDEYYEMCSLMDATPKQFLRWLERQK